MEDTSYVALKRSLASVPVKALSYSGRIILSNDLNVKFVLPSKNGHARDYRGLAELMGFGYKEIKLFEQHEDPTMKILKSWEVLSHATLDKLINYLEEMERHDVINELVPLLERNIESYSQDQRLQDIPKQVPKVTTHPFRTRTDTGFRVISCREKYLNLRKLEEKRSEYTCKSNFKTLDDIAPWSQYAKNVHPYNCVHVFSKKPRLNEKISVFVGDITLLEIDAIVNSTNPRLIGVALAGVDKAIHRAAGPKLLEECQACNVCIPGDAKITGGYKLPAKYVIHASGPVRENRELLESCYRKSLRLAQENNLRSIAFPCISTGIRGYPNFKAAHVALGTVREFLEKNETSALSRILLTAKGRLEDLFSRVM